MRETFFGIIAFILLGLSIGQNLHATTPAKATISRDPSVRVVGPIRRAGAQGNR